MDELKGRTLPLLEEAEEIVILNQYKKESVVFQAREKTFLAFLWALPEMLAGWQQELRYASTGLRTLVAAYCPLITNELFEDLSRDGYAAALRVNPHLPGELRSLLLSTQLVSSLQTLDRFAVARDPQASQEDLRVLARDSRAMVRAAVASNPRINEDLAYLVLEDYMPSVRAALASNESVPRPALAILLNDPTVPVRAAVAGNPGLPTKAFYEFITSPDEKIRTRLAANPNLPSELFWHLAADPSLTVQCGLATNPSLPLDLLTRLLLTENLSLWENIARNPQASREMLVWMAQKKHENMYEAIAQNKNASIDLLRQLAREVENPQVTFWYALASHPQTPIDVLQLILSHPNLKPDIFLRIVNHPGCVSERDQLLFNHFIHCLQGEMQCGTSRFKLLLVTHPNAPVEVLETFAHSERWEERYLVARHPKTPPALLKTLQADTVFRVRTTASKRVSAC